MDRYNEIQNIKAAILRGDSEYNGVKLPTKQTTGTSVQIDTYAGMQADIFYSKNQLKL